MGHNLISACHKCRVQQFHFRNEEQLTILPFYLSHKECAKQDINNVQTVIDNNGTEIYLNGEKLGENYAEDSRNALKAVLEKLGYSVEFNWKE